MEEAPNGVERSNQTAWADRLRALVEVLLLSGVVSSFIAAVPFSLRGTDSVSLLTNARTVTTFLLVEASITLLLLFLALRIHGETLRDFGLLRESWKVDVMLGLAVVPVLFAINVFIVFVFRNFFPRYFIDRNPLTDIIRTPLDLGLFLISALVAGGLKEELQRAFILCRFRDHLGGARLGLLLWSAIFGIGHYIQGPQGIVAAGLFGLIFGVVYLARGNLIPPITAHAVYDTLALLGYWFYGRE
jgi:membrane protease YdiL (CAAX protease family)